MPAKLCKRIEKNLNEAAQEQSVVFQDFASRCRTVETLKHWEEQHRDQEGRLYNVKSTDLVFIQFSSGSTGDPKGVMLTHENILTNIYDMSVSAAWTDKDKSLSWMPLTHDMGLIGLHITPLVLQCNQYLMSTFLFAFYPLTWMQKVSAYNISITACPNFGYEHFLTYLNEEEFTNLNLSSLRIILNGAEPISYKICAHFLKALSIYSLNQNVILPVYGLAEGALAITNNPLYEGITTHNIKRSSLTIGNKIKTITGENEADCTLLVDLGTPVGKVTLDIRNEKGESLPEERTGVLYIKGRNVTQGYYNNPIATKNCLTEDGWFNTGDLGFIKNNRLTIIGRQKEILFVNGNNYYSNDIERVASEIRGVSMGKIGICGIENVNQGYEDIVVFIQFKKSIEQFIPMAEQVKEKILQQTGLQVKYVIPIKKVPLTTSGKVRRFVLKEKFMKGEYNDKISDLQTISHSKDNLSSVQENTQGNKIERIILSSWQKNSRANKTIGLKENFLEAGGDSLLLAKVASDLAHIFQGKVSVTDFFAYPTVAKLASTINKRLSASSVNLQSVKLNKTFLASENTGRHLFNTCIKKEIIDAIFQGNQDIKYLEELLLTCYAFIIGKMADQQEITFYISKNNQNTFLPCTIIPG
jgi:surfactin family lipopeptide synthetase A